MLNFYQHIHQSLIQNAGKELMSIPQQDGQYQHFSGAQLLQTISGYRSQLFKKNISPGEKILVLLPVGTQLINAVLAIQSIGAIPVLPPASAGFIQIRRVLKSQRINTLLIAKELSFPLQLLAKIICKKNILLQDNIDNDAGWQPALTPPQQAALISQSSGSTGRYKAICRSHKVLSAQHKVLTQVFPPWPHQRDFPLFPNIILHNLATGVHTTMPFIPRFKLARIEPEKILLQLQQQKISSLTGNVFYFKKLLQPVTDQRPFPLVKAVGIGGSPVPENLAHSVRKLFSNAGCFIIYGSSEAEPIAVRKLTAKKEHPLMGFAVGFPVEAIRLRIQEEVEIITPAGNFICGEIEVQGQHVALPEYKEWLSTGDYGYLKNNQLFLTARRGNERPQKGIQHYQAEHLLLLQKGVEAVGVKSCADGFRIYIAGTITKTEVEKLMLENLPGGIVKGIYFRNKLPTDHRHLSKILYAKLR